MLKYSTILALSLAAGAASAQDAGWTYKASLYGWLPSMTTSVDTKFGTVDIDQSSSDVLENLDMAFMGTFSAQNGAWGFVGDLLYANLSDTNPTPHGIAFDSTSMDLKLTAISGYALYRLTNGSQTQFDVGVGFRNFDMGIDASAQGGSHADVAQSIDQNWTDPLIAARLMVPFNDDWFLSGFADWGGTSSSDQTYQVYTGIGYNFNEAWSAQLGYRYMDISHAVKGNDVSIGLSGALVGVTYSF